MRTFWLKLIAPCVLCTPAILTCLFSTPVQSIFSDQTTIHNDTKMDGWHSSLTLDAGQGRYKGKAGKTVISKLNERDVVKVEDPVMTGADFVEWSAASDNDGTWNATEKIYTAADKSNDTLTANWKLHTYTIHFVANIDGATGIMADQHMEYNQTATLYNSTFAAKGYQFLGWSTSKDGTVKYSNMS